MADPEEHGDDRDALLSRLRLIEDQQLSTRAVAFEQLHEQLRAKLESGDQPRNG